MCSMFGSSFEACAAAVFSTALTPFYTVPDVSAVSHHTSQRAQNAAAGSLEATLNRRYRPLKDAEPQLWLSHYHKWGHLHGGLRDYHLGWLYLGKCQHGSIWVEIVDPTLLGGRCPRWHVLPTSTMLSSPTKRQMLQDPWIQSTCRWYLKIKVIIYELGKSEKLGILIYSCSRAKTGATTERERCWSNAECLGEVPVQMVLQQQQQL